MDILPPAPVDVVNAFAKPQMIDAATAVGISLPPGLSQPFALAPAAASLAPAATPQAPAAVSAAAPLGAASEDQPIAAPRPSPAAGEPAGATVEAALAVAPAPAELAVIVGGPARSRIVPLGYPLAYAGKRYDAIMVRRPSSAEVGAFFERVSEGVANGDTGNVRFPVFMSPDGSPIPEAVWRAMDDEDEERVAEVGLDFLPPRLARLRAAFQPGSVPSDGDSTAPTSSV